MDRRGVNVRGFWCRRATDKGLDSFYSYRIPLADSETHTPHICDVTSNKYICSF